MVEAYDTSTPVFGAYVDRVEQFVASGDLGDIAEVDALVRREAPGAPRLRGGR